MGGKVYGPGNSKQVIPGIRLIHSIQPGPLDGAVIQHRQVNLFLTTRGMDIVRQMFGVDPQIHRPERINQKIDYFNETLKEIRDNKDALDNLLPWQKEQFEKRIKFLFDQFDISANQAIEGYEKGVVPINKSDARRRGEETIDLINQEIKTISEDLQKGKNIWKTINLKLDKLKNNNQLSLLEAQIVVKQVTMVKMAYNTALTYSGRSQNPRLLSTEMQIFEQSANLLKRMLDKLEEEIKKDLTELTKEAKKGKDSINRITKALQNISTCRNYLSEFESQRLGQLLRKQADASEKAYHEVSANSQKRQNRAQLKSGTQQLKDIADSLKQTQIRLEKGWIDSIDRRAQASENWFNANSYIPEKADEPELMAIKEKYQLIRDTAKIAEENIAKQKDDLSIEKIRSYDKSVTSLENLENALVKLAFPSKFQDIQGVMKQMASIETISHIEFPFKGIGPSNQMTEVLREIYARLYDVARTSTLEALRADINYAVLIKAQHAVNRAEAAQKGLKEITPLVEQTQELLDMISRLEGQIKLIDTNNQTTEKLGEAYSTLYNDARASIVKTVQAGISEEALTELQEFVMRLQSQMHLLTEARMGPRPAKRRTKNKK